MIDLAKFKQLASVQGFSVADVPLALQECVTYTFNDFDRVGDLRYHDGTSWVAGYDQLLHFANAPEANMNDQAFMITVNDGTSNKLGIVFVAGDSWFNQYHALFETEGIRTAVANAFGYDDAVLITGYVALGLAFVKGYNDDNRSIGLIPTYSTKYIADTNWNAVESQDKPDVATIMGSPFPATDPARRSPFAVTSVGSTMYIVAPIEHYNTDAENVATLNTTCDKLLRQRVSTLATTIDGQIETLTLAFANVAELAGNLSVFGNTVKDVATRYNNVAQYIPRP